MRRAPFATTLLLIIAAATLVSGCASGPATAPASTGTPSLPPTATSPATAEPATVLSGSLFDTGGLSWCEYRVTTTGDNTGVSDVRYDFTTAKIMGIDFKDDRVTMKLEAPEVVVVMDGFYDVATGRQAGTQTKVTSAGAVLDDQDVAAIKGRCLDCDIAGAYADGDWPMQDAGADSVTVDGKTYSCTKYVLDQPGEAGAAWAAGGVPVPVKVESESSGGATTWELTGWG